MLSSNYNIILLKSTYKNPVQIMNGNKSTRLKGLQHQINQVIHGFNIVATERI